jgi:RimJ/RimL family protein N-acetyltransferase
LTGLLPVYLSNPDYVNITEGSADRPGHYDLVMLQRDWQVAAITPGRIMAGVYLRKSQTPVGILDILDKNPSDGLPWIGLLMIHGKHQRLGYARETYLRIARFFREEKNATILRIGVIAENQPAHAFWASLGFQEVERVQKRLPGGMDTIVKMDAKL